MEEIFNNQSELQAEQNYTETTDKVVELTDELADQHLSEIGLGDDTESEKESEKKPKEDKLSAYEKAVLAEMERRAGLQTEGAEVDWNLVHGMESKDKNIHECWQYITAQAKKKAVAGCAMIEDDIVFGWAHHYYIEPKAVIDAELHPKPKDKPKTDTKTPAKTDTKPSKGKGSYKNIIPLPTKKGGKKAESKSNDKVYTKKVGDKTFTITEFALF